MPPAPDAADPSRSRPRTRFVDTSSSASPAPLTLVTLATTVAGAVVLLAAAAAGRAFLILATLLLALVLAWSWPSLSGSVTPRATSVVLAVSAVAIVLSAVRDDLRWVAAAVALGIVLSFFAQLRRTSGREGLVISLLSAFGGLALIASATAAVVVDAADGGRGRAIIIVALAAVVAALVADLFAGVVRRPALLGSLAVILGLCAAVAVGLRSSGDTQPPTGLAVAVGAAAGALSWAFRRVIATSHGDATPPAQVAAGVGSLLAVGAVVNLAAVLT